MAKKKRAKIRARTVSAARLSKVVDRAAKRASEARKIRIDKDTIILKDILVGRRLREKVTLQDANRIAKDITATVAKSKKSLGLIKPEPAVMALDKYIWVGFIEPRVDQFRF